MFSIIKVGHPAPSFTAKASVAGVEKTISLSDYQGKWVILFFYPADFTFICPTEVKAFQDKLKQFSDLNTEVLGCSVDSHFVHRAWAESLGGIDYPLLADVHHTLSVDYNVFIEEDAQSLRGTFIISPDGILKWMCVSDNNVGRSVEEVKRVLDALQTGKLCPIDWKNGDKFLN
jgi:peroxiredoxin (alkyl hydroperoxide reductase subunit C)